MQQEFLRSLRPIYMYVRNQRQSNRSQEIFERGVQDPFGWSSEDVPSQYESGFNLSGKGSLNGSDKWCMGGSVNSSSNNSSSNNSSSNDIREDSNGVPRGSVSPARSNSIPTHLYGLERYVSNGLDELSTRDCRPIKEERKKSLIEMSLARSFSREE